MRPALMLLSLISAASFAAGEPPRLDPGGVLVAARLPRAWVLQAVPKLLGTPSAMLFAHPRVTLVHRSTGSFEPEGALARRCPTPLRRVPLGKFTVDACSTPLPGGARRWEFVLPARAKGARTLHAWSAEPVPGTSGEEAGQLVEALFATLEWRR